MNHWTSVIEGLLFMIGDDGLSIEQLEHVLEINVKSLSSHTIKIHHININKLLI